jgi:hypothetical protein
MGQKIYYGAHVRSSIILGYKLWRLELVQMMEGILFLASIGSSQWIFLFKQQTLPLLTRLWFPNSSLISSTLIKFKYSEKATKFCEIFTLLLS